ncbi:unnamed protein product [Owenia fusiformis]|uniref:Uncharacterized protein n=1 Tax=Owenia fusiformis TaxID=6347 RepID=A0A8J1XH02_OWEFU|nr:unnamed protein product [Owenia fusiformis]
MLSDPNETPGPGGATVNIRIIGSIHVDIVTAKTLSETMISVGVWHQAWVGIVVLLYCVAETSGCFITNCPPGGKRSMDTHSNHPCMACGPNDAGQCIGPNICCMPGMGCYIGTIEAKPCRHENDNRVLCQVYGSPCEKVNGGNCVDENICCNTESCAYDGRCRLDTNVIRNRFSPDILRILRDLLDAKRIVK